jgi:hypothetical protein
MEIVQNGDLTQGMLDSISHGDSLYVYAEVLYADPADGSMHHTHACFKYNGDVKTGSPLGFYNCTVEDGYNDAN